MSSPAASVRVSVAASPFLATTVGKKIVMAVTGIVLYGYVLGHMTGNLLVFKGPEALNGYAEFLHTFLHGAGIWIARSVLLVSIVLHIWSSYALATGSWRARNHGYRSRHWREATFSSRTMRWSGPLIAAFVVYHLLHLTVGSAHPDFRPGDVYHNVIVGFSSWPVTLFYALAVTGLAIHLYHGAWSMLHTLGLSHPRWNPLRFGACATFTTLMLAGFLSVPFAVLFGALR